MAIHTKLRSFVFPFNAYASPIWRIRILDDHKNSIDVVTSIIIDSEVYTRVFTHAALRNNTKSWYMDNVNPIRIFVHFDNHNPPFVFTKFQFRVQYQTDPIINNLITAEAGDFIVTEPDINIITFREMEA